MLRSTPRDSRFHPRLAGALAAALLAALAPWGAARPIERTLGLPEVVGQSAVVVLAEVLSVNSAYLDTPQGKAPFIIYQARAARVLLGADPKNFALVIPGLISSGRIIADADSPSLRTGARYVVFLRPAPGAPAQEHRFMLTGGAAWVLLAIPGPDPQDPLVMVPSLPAPGQSGPARTPLTVSDLAGQIQAIAENRGAGKKP